MYQIAAQIKGIDMKYRHTLLELCCMVLPGLLSESAARCISRVLPAFSGFRSANAIVTAANCFVFQYDQNLQMCKEAESVLGNEVKVLL